MSPTGLLGCQYDTLKFSVENIIECDFDILPRAPYNNSVCINYTFFKVLLVLIDGQISIKLLTISIVI